MFNQLSRRGLLKVAAMLLGKAAMPTPAPTLNYGAPVVVQLAGEPVPGEILETLPLDSFPEVNYGPLTGGQIVPDDVQARLLARFAAGLPEDVEWPSVSVAWRDETYPSGTRVIRGEGSTELCET